MNSRRSYLESLNAGRQRRPDTSLEQLNRSLENLEQRLERAREETAANLRAPQRQSPVPAYAPRPDVSRSAAPNERSYQSIAREIERVRGQEDGLAAAGQIASELKSLREEMRHQMTSGLKREFDTLRTEIARAYQSGASGTDGVELGLEFERLSGAIHALAEKSDDKSVNMLRLELEQVRRALADLAREETVLSSDRRWDDFDRRWADFTDRMSADVRQRAEEPGLASLANRLEQINNAVNSLPESLSLHSIEEKVRTLAGAVDHFVRQHDTHGDDMFGLIEERLDEISRAIVASTVAARTPNFDPEPFERIEARISALARQIEEVAQDRPTGEIIERLNTLSGRVDELATRTDIPEQAVERLGRQISLIADKIDKAPAAPDSALIFQGIEQRFDALAGVFERRQGDAIEHGNALFHDLEHRLQELADRLDRKTSEPPIANTIVLDVIDARLDAFAQRLETSQANNTADDAIRGLEARLDDISNRLEISSAQVASIDQNLIRSLEAQVSELSGHLSRPGSPLPEFEDIRPRIEEIERSLLGNHEHILEAARQAAENAVKSFDASGAESAAVAGLAQDLKTLEALTRRSDERNSKTFEAIHDTLLKIVDRLGSLETYEPAIRDVAAESTKVDAPAVKLTVQDAPSLEPDEPMPLPLASETVDFGRRTVVPPRADAETRSPAQAAAEAAAAVSALGGERGPQGQAKAAKKSVFDGLTRAFSGKKATEAAAEPLPADPIVETPALALDLDLPLDPKIANRPLEPGSGAPDLSAIMKRVRDERGQPARQGETDAAKSDFIAAARRAAQAAAAEANAMKRSAEIKGPVRALRIGDLIKARRKPIMMAAGAVMLALAGLQLGKAFLTDPAEMASSKVPLQTADQQIQTASANDAARQAETSSAPARVVDQPQAAAPAETSDASKIVAGAAPEVAPFATSSETTQSIARAPTTTLANGPATDPFAGTASTISVPSEAGPVALREAANAGDAKALFEIASRYAEGHGVKTDSAQAAIWYEKAAELGFAPAQYRIGNLFEKGIGVERDVSKAKTWYQLAAAQGNASAMHNLAVLYAMGADGTTDNDSAARWFINAAELGVKDSQFNLGILAAKGVGMKQNLEESYKWFALVAKQGDNDAASKRDEIASALRPEQLERAQAAVELWKPKPLDPVSNSAAIPEAWQDNPATTGSIDLKKAVQNIQAILNKNGYEAGKADGVIGQQTKDAIVAFQKDNDMAPTGEVDEKLVRALLVRK